ncbi:YgaP family membrane protein [Cytobacillus dafuensis]|uniref:DUF2892 domain-containing protein n=1 Tax=Cytobacillus dafuensis TaxID=1742359 RepID=A0A5B8Z9P9_CYTDA|nr:DUF2892 domain-containing protein [Cytobacillus dafuensis]QED49872.1 DUF2892 domain-containing protein [Cytobacillus dafuensis]
MKVNIGSPDRILRLVLGVLMLGLFMLDGNVKYLGILGIVFILTSIIRFCPLYTIFGINTCKR